MFPGVRLVLATWLLTTTMFLACTTHTTEPIPSPIHPAPHADSPAHAVEAFRWSWENTSFETYRTLFTDDFVFAFATLDTNGNTWSNGTWSRANELLSFQHLMNGGGTSPPAAQVTLVLDRTFRVSADPRPGKEDASLHRLIVSQCNLTVQLSDGTALNINGKLGLYLVRGDVAVLPADLGRAPDSTTWYVERWEDQTFAGGQGTAYLVASRADPRAAQPSKSSTWGSLKALYLEAAPPPPALARARP